MKCALSRGSAGSCVGGKPHWGFSSSVWWGNILCWYRKEVKVPLYHCHGLQITTCSLLNRTFIILIFISLSWRFFHFNRYVTCFVYFYNIIWWSVLIYLLVVQITRGLAVRNVQPGLNRGEYWSFYAEEGQWKEGDAAPSPHRLHQSRRVQYTGICASGGRRKKSQCNLIISHLPS